MRIHPGCFGHYVLLAAALCAPLAVHAAGPDGRATVRENDLVRLDGIIQTLKDESLEFTREAQLVEQTVLYPDHSRVTVYVGARANQLLLKTVSVTIDGGAPINYEFSDRDARALVNSGGLYRLTILNTTPGTHQLRAEVTAQYDGAKADAPPVTTSIVQVFDKTPQPLELELSVVSTGLFSKPQALLVSWAADDAILLSAPNKRSAIKRKRPQ